MKHLFSVDMLSSADGWAVGSDGCIIRWDGTSWLNVSSPTSSWLSAVSMVDSTDGWIVGADGGIFRWEQQGVVSPMVYFGVAIVVVVLVVAVVVWFFLRKR